MAHMFNSSYVDLSARHHGATETGTRQVHLKEMAAEAAAAPYTAVLDALRPDVVVATSSADGTSSDEEASEGVPYVYASYSTVRCFLDSAQESSDTSEEDHPDSAGQAKKNDKDRSKKKKKKKTTKANKKAFLSLRLPTRDKSDISYKATSADDMYMPVTLEDQGGAYFKPASGEKKVPVDKAWTEPNQGKLAHGVQELVSHFNQASAYATSTPYSTLVSPRSGKTSPQQDSGSHRFIGYSTPVLRVEGSGANDLDTSSGDDVLDGDYFPVTGQLPPPLSPSEFKKKQQQQMNKHSHHHDDDDDDDDGASLAEELAVRQKVAGLLASLPTDASRRRVLAQLTSVYQQLHQFPAADAKKKTNKKQLDVVVVDPDSGFEVIEPEDKDKKIKKKTAMVLEKKKKTSPEAEKDLAVARMGSAGRQWNEEYQRVVSKGLSSLDADDVSAISRLSHDFVKHAEIYAKVIINELNMPDHLKTIKPASVGGVAGGAKYIVQGILFKFCLDPLVAKKPAMWLYGGDRPGDDHAMKAAGLELQGLGLVATAKLPELHLPLMALVDYKGFRMVATCLLPIGPNTLRYGSNDAGRTIKAAENDSKLAGLMDELGRHLNLRKHLVGKQRVAVVGPGDVEGHLGTDGRYYLLDFARLMPPETPLPDEEGEIDGRGVFFRMLRPELVRSFHVPLSSDTFTGWGMYDENYANYELDVREATDLMLNERIPAVAEEINQLYGNVPFSENITPAEVQACVEHLNLVARVHGHGVNLRHLGRIRQLMTSAQGQRLILAMALSRAFKTKLRKRMRNSVQHQTHAGASSESACKDVVLEFFNTVLGHTERSAHFWAVGIKRLLRRKFPFVLSEEEARPDYNLRNSSCIKLTFMLSLELGLVRVPSAVKEAIYNDPSAVRLVETDILDIPASIKHNQLSSLFDGNICMFEAETGNHNATDALRLLHQARSHLMKAANMTPSCPYTMWVLGTVEADIALRLPSSPESERFYTSAYMRFARSCQLDKKNAGPLDSWAKTLEQHALRLETEAPEGAAGDEARARANEMRSLAEDKRHQAHVASGVTTCPLLTQHHK